MQVVCASVHDVLYVSWPGRYLPTYLIEPAAIPSGSQANQIKNRNRDLCIFLSLPAILPAKSEGGSLRFKIYLQETRSRDRYRSGVPLHPLPGLHGRRINVLPENAALTGVL